MSKTLDIGDPCPYHVDGTWGYCHECELDEDAQKANNATLKERLADCFRRHANINTRKGEGENE
jgi:hypothetical protein